MSAKLQNIQIVRHNGGMTERYLSLTEIGRLWGITPPAVTLAFKDVEPDAVIGSTRGWKHETVDQVQQSRPGSGNWGPRTDAAPKLQAKAKPRAKAKPKA